MKKIIFFIIISLFSAGVIFVALKLCRDETQYGRCVGIDDAKNPNLVYDVSTRNVVLAVIFSETLVVPIVVVFDKLYCPVSPADTNTTAKP